MSQQLHQVLQSQSTAVSMQQRISMLQAMLFLGIGLVALYGHFMLTAAAGPVGFIWLVGMMMTSQIVSAEFALAILLLCLFLQNAFIGLVVPLIKTPSQFSLLQGSSFIVIFISALFGTGVWLKLKQALIPDNKLLLYTLAVFFVVILFYTGLGAISATPMDAAIYARVYLAGGFLLIIGIAMGLQLSLSYFVNIVKLMAFVLLVWAAAEFCYTFEMYRAFHVLDFFNLKFSSLFNADGYNSIAEVIGDKSVSYLNLSGAFGLDFRILRLSGPNIHPISFAYSLAFCGMVCFIYRAHFLMLGCFLGALLIGAKGTILMVLFPLLLYFYYSVTRNRALVLLGLVTTMTLYFVFGLVYGFYTKDYHVVGFMGGVHGFFSNPFGHGIGVGGNLSGLAVKELDFGLFQNHGASFALESAFGVMLYQIGIGTFVFMLFFWRFWHSLWKATKFFSAEPRLIVAPCALGYLFVNCVFQEEALSPSGWGLWLLFSGFILAKYWRFEAAQRAENAEAEAAAAAVPAATPTTP